MYLKRLYESLTTLSETMALYYLGHNKLVDIMKQPQHDFELMLQYIILFCGHT